MKEFISSQMARKLVPSIIGWMKIQRGYEWYSRDMNYQVGKAGPGMYYRKPCKPTW